MPKFRVDIESPDGWRLLHGLVDARTAEEAESYIRTTLPHRCAGKRLRVKERPKTTLQPIGAERHE